VTASGLPTTDSKPAIGEKNCSGTACRRLRKILAVSDGLIWLHGGTINQYSFFGRTNWLWVMTCIGKFPRAFT